MEGHGDHYKAPTMEERKSERLRGERDQIKFIDVRFERWQLVGFGKEEEGQTFHELHVLGMNGDL